MSGLGGRSDSHVVGAVCRVRARKFPFGYYRAALPAVLDYHRRFGDYLHSCRADAQSGDVFTVPAARECREKEQAFPLYRPLSAKGNKFYGRTIVLALGRSRRMFAAFGILLVGIWAMNRLAPQSFMSQEDQGYFTVELELPEAPRSSGRARSRTAPCAS